MFDSLQSKNHSGLEISENRIRDGPNISSMGKFQGKLGKGGKQPSLNIAGLGFAQP
jgi:hypothetical protein